MFYDDEHNPDDKPVDGGCGYPTDEGQPTDAEIENHSRLNPTMCLDDILVDLALHGLTDIHACDRNPTTLSEDIDYIANEACHKLNLGIVAETCPDVRKAIIALADAIRRTGLMV